MGSDRTTMYAFRLILLLLSYIVLYLRSNETKFDYYWRDYTGEIPDDAIPGGYDIDEKPTYIGSIFIKGKGTFPTAIHSGTRKVTVSYGGQTFSSDVLNRILCSPKKQHFIWVPTTCASFDTDTVGKYLVPGGSEEGGILNIRRAQYQGEFVIGKIRSYADMANLYFPYKDREQLLLSYEVLAYEMTKDKK